MNSTQIAAIEKFVEALQAKVLWYHQDSKFSFPPDKITVQYGKKYAKIVRVGMPHEQSKSVHCFIEIASGDIYKAASWAAPAKHVRGNINSPDGGMSAVGVYGANYLRG